MEFVVQSLTPRESALPCQSRTLSHDSILGEYYFLFPMGQALFIKLGGIYGNVSLCPLGYEANNLVRTMMNLPSYKGRDTPYLQVHLALI